MLLSNTSAADLFNSGMILIRASTRLQLPICFSSCDDTAFMRSVLLADPCFETCFPKMKLKFSLP